MLQLGGNNPESLGEAVALASRYDYDEINIKYVLERPLIHLPAF